ncbi:MAG: hypothetical protein FWD27_05535 [Coriobacteriia bacterium]|nr:hypothetical protein [Coriobacteriia bacterium]
MEKTEKLEQQSLPVQDRCKNCRTPVYPEQKNCPECLAKLPWRKAARGHPPQLDYSDRNKYGQDTSWILPVAIVLVIALSISLGNWMGCTHQETPEAGSNSSSSSYGGVGVLPQNPPQKPELPEPGQQPIIVCTNCQKVFPVDDFKTMTQLEDDGETHAYYICPSCDYLLSVPEDYYLSHLEEFD